MNLLFNSTSWSTIDRHLHFRHFVPVTIKDSSPVLINSHNGGWYISFGQNTASKFGMKQFGGNTCRIGSFWSRFIRRIVSMTRMTRMMTMPVKTAIQSLHPLRGLHKLSPPHHITKPLNYRQWFGDSTDPTDPTGAGFLLMTMMAGTSLKLILGRMSLCRTDGCR